MAVIAARIEEIRLRFEALAPVLDERQLRLWAAAEATALGRGGIAAVTEATGIRGKRIWHGRRDLRELANAASPLARKQRVRRPGAGRKPLVETDPTVVADLEAMIEPTGRGDPESSLRWTTKSTRELSRALKAKGHTISPQRVGVLLRNLGYSLQANRKRLEGADHPDRDAQFRYIQRRTKEMQRAGQPVISVDTKKKELIGPFANKGAEWRPQGEPVDVRVHDFLDPDLGKAVPYGVYDVSRNEGFVNVGTSADTGAFAVQGIRAWWTHMGRKAYPEAKELLVVADSGGSNGSRNRLWKTELQRFADDTGLHLHVSHMPPGTSKWNKIEHRLFSFISMNWRGKPLDSYETVVNLIAHTTTTAGLVVKARVDRRRYKRGIVVTKERMAQLKVRPRRFHGDWNYDLLPRAQ
jgi:hypothetical protein